MATVTLVGSEPRMSLPELIKRFNREDKCRAYLEELRWPKGPVCPKCEKKNIARVGGREEVLRCTDCQHQFTVTVGTIFHDSHLPLSKWFLVAYLICESKKGMSALQLKRLLDIGGYKTAWYLCHRIRQAMMAANGEEPKLSGVVEVDDTWIGGKARRNRPIPEKINVVGMVERDGRLRLSVVPDLSTLSLEKAIKKNIGRNIDLIITDEWAAYVRAVGPTYKKKYRRIKHAQSYVVGDIHTNSIENAFSLLKRGIIGSWHKVSVKHLQRYLEEVAFRFSQRKNPALFSLTLLNLLTTDPLTFKTLTKEKAA